MKKNSRWLLPTLLVAFIIAIIALSYRFSASEMVEPEVAATTSTPEEVAAEQAPVTTEPAAPVGGSASDILAVRADEAIIGSANAPVTIVEYSSLTCPHCAHFNTDVLPKIKASLLDTGKAKLVQRDFPLNEPALKGAMLIKCAGKERATAFVEVLFATQRNWAFEDDFLENLKQIASVGGMSEERFDVCMADKAIEEAVLQERKLAADVLKVESTPTFFVNGKRAIEGGGTPEQFEKAVADAPQAAEPAAENNATPSPDQPIVGTPAE